MADNTLQFRWIVTIKEGWNESSHRPDVFVAADLFWYPVEGKPEICTAPDALVAFGRPKGDRGSYKQWEEGRHCAPGRLRGLSPNNRVGEMDRKLSSTSNTAWRNTTSMTRDEIEAVSAGDAIGMT